MRAPGDHETNASRAPSAARPAKPGPLRHLTPQRAVVRSGNPIPSPPPPRRPKLLDRLRQALCARHYSPLSAVTQAGRTEQTCCHWARRFIFFHHVRHPAEMAEPEINAFLTHRAVKEAIRKAGIVKRAICHTFRHSFATHPHTTSGENDITEDNARGFTPYGWRAALQNVCDMLTGSAVLCSYLDPDTQ